MPDPSPQLDLGHNPDLAPAASGRVASALDASSGPVPDPATLPTFPAGFTWGTATASYQVEGAVHEDGRGRSVWDTFAHTEGRVLDGSTGDVACDQYHRYEEDAALMAGLGSDAYRFSVAWSRIQPDGRGPANDKGLDYYRRLLDALDARGIAANATIYHWDLPQALEDEGGWLERDTALRFGDYAAILGRAFGERVAMWAPLNEPFVHWSQGYAIGTHAPGRTLLFDSLPVAHHLLLGHGLAVQALRAASATGRIGIANNHSVVRPATASEEDLAAAGLFELLRNRLFAEPLLLGAYPEELLGLLPEADLSFMHPHDAATIAQPLDFYGVNFYNPEVVRADGGSPLGFDFVEPDGEVTGFGWAVEPDALRELLVGLHARYGDRLPPVHITENGASYPDVPGEGGIVDDRARIRYLDGHIRAVRAAIDEGVDVRGYFAWSLLDNFEWAAGFTQRFGLVHVDFDTLQRTPKASYAWFRDAIAASRP